MIARLTSAVKIFESALSKKAGLARSHVGSYLADRIHELNDETLSAIASAAGVRVEWLRDGIGDPVALDIQRGIEHESLLDALVTAFRRHPDANMSDLDAVRRLVTGDAAPKIPAERAVDILSGWLTASRTAAAERGRELGYPRDLPVKPLHRRAGTSRRQAELARTYRASKNRLVSGGCANSHTPTSVSHALNNDRLSREV